MKHRIIPTILTDGTTVVKGENFNNWRTVGSAEATARLYAARDVDELIFLDVNASKKNRSVSLDLVRRFSEILQVPFGIGGGISSIEFATELLRAGAEKVLLGEVASINPRLVSQIAEKFGSQAVTVSIDLCGSENLSFRNCDERFQECNALEFALFQQQMGAGEILLNSIVHDGLRAGMDLKRIQLFSESLSIPLVASSGAGSIEDFASALSAGASAVAAGAIFQFSELTPGDVREGLRNLGFGMRRI